jgi:hypothetical protein
MARMPNFIGSQSPWGQALSNLGTALFGDPSEQMKIQQAEQEAAYRTEQIATLRMQRELAQKEADRVAAARQQYLGGGGAAPTTAPAPSTGVPAVDPSAAAAAAQALTSGPQTQLAAPFVEAPPEPTVQQQPLPVLPTKVNLPMITDPAVTATPEFAQTYASGGRAVPPVASGTGPQGFYDALGLRESGDNWQAQAPTSSAYGRYQFTTPTAAAVGMPADHAAWTPEVQQAGAETLTSENLAGLRQALGHEPTAADIYAAHHFGLAAAVKIAQAPYNTPLSAILGDAAMQANPYLRGLTVGKWIEGTDRVPGVGTDFGMGQPFAGRQDASLAAPFTEDQGGTPMADATAPAAQPVQQVSAAAQPAPGQASLANSDLFSAADLSAEATAPPLAGDVTQAAATGGGTDIASQLDDYDKAILAMTPDSKFDETLAKILAAKQKKAGTGGDWLAGEGLDQQMFNTVVTYEMKKKNNEPTTPAEDYQYQLALAHLQEPKYDPQTQTTRQLNLPHLWTPETPASPEQGQGATGTAQQPPQGVTATQVSQPQQPNTLQQTGGVQETVNPDGTRTQRIGNMTVTLGPDSGSKISIEDSAKMAGLQNGVAELSLARSILAPNGQVNRKRLAEGSINIDQLTNMDLGFGEGLPWTEGRSARQSILRGIEAVKRAYTGAALTGSEKVDFNNQFVPNLWDSDAEVERKLNALDAWLKSTYTNFAKGRPQFADVGTPGAEQWWQSSAAVPQQQAPAQPQALTAGGGGGVTLPSGTPDDPLGIRIKPQVQQ